MCSIRQTATTIAAKITNAAARFLALTSIHRANVPHVRLNSTIFYGKNSIMKKVRTLIGHALFAAGIVGFAATATATTFGTDMTDLWWNANESGWGVTATQQNEILFLTFFVYGTDNRAVWYVGQTSYSGATADGAAVFTGPMYVTTGPWLGTFFNPNAVGARLVGTATFTAFVDSATLNYSVDGTFVSKQVTRQTFRINNLNNQYSGVRVQAASGCAAAVNNGTFESSIAVSIVNSSTAFAMTTNNGAAICSYTGDYVQSGRMGASRGTYTCPGIAGNYNFFEIEANPSGITARMTANDNLCSQYSGRFAGARR